MKTVTLNLTVWNAELTDIETLQREGTYTGTKLNGVPDGQGKFTAVNTAGKSWYYEGEFKDGAFDGQGATIWESSKCEIGTYKKGLFTPTTGELFNSIGPYSYTRFEISDKNLAFMQANQNFFPATSEDAIAQASSKINPDMTYPMMTKTLNGLEEQFFQCNKALATQVCEENLYGHTVTTIITCDENYNFFNILFDGSLPDIYDDTNIEFVGLPVAPSGFDNVSGGTTNVIVIASSLHAL